jgi:hypothetical protein
MEGGRLKMEHRVLYRAGKLLCDTLMVDTLPSAFIKTHGILQYKE